MTAEDRDRQLEDQLVAELSPTDVPVYLWTGAFRASDDRYLVPVSLGIAGQAVAGDDGRAAGTIDLLGDVRDEKGREVGRIKGTIPAPPSADVRRTLLQYNSGFALAPGRYRLKFVVRENRTGALGSFESPLELTEPNPTPEALSAIALAARTQRAGGGHDLPLAWGDEQVVPSVTRVFSTGQDLLVYFEAADRLAPTAEPSVRIERDGHPIATLEHDLTLDRRAVPARRAQAYRARVPLARLGPGSYVCRVTVGSGADAAVEAVPFVVR
jgi:hypothetical protein